MHETHQQLPPQPPSGSRTLVFFAHFDLQGVVDPYVVYYLDALRRLDATIIFVSGSPNITSDSVSLIRPLCAGIYTRRTLSLDFGSWHLAWNILKESGWTLDQFDRFVIANDSVFGPLYPIEEMWDSFYGADMYGAIESLEQVRHLQSFFVAWDLNRRTRPFLEDFWNGFQYTVKKWELIKQYEIGLSVRARESGLVTKPFLSAETVLRARAASHEDRYAAHFVERGNSTLFFWDGLIEMLRFPFLKASLPRYKHPWHDSLATLDKFIETHTPYPAELIRSNVERLGLGQHP
ncbi:MULTISPECIES: rhamnan synthesis F family protein [unclassified Mycobacterium]|uniref:rhamnan synthesis F family protein n=1 Tax=unclassified Mycobacterium TaxID=2642494 RepID=UPI00049218BE|nr:MULTISPECIES: rhamnan synthesis F family protein [unclassified Mycobacterium]